MATVAYKAPLSPEIPVQPFLSSLSNPRKRQKGDNGPENCGDFLRTQFVLIGHSRSVSNLKFHPHGSVLASCGADQTIFLWDHSDGRMVRQLNGHKLGVDEIAWSHDGRYLASASDDMTVKLWDSEMGSCIGTLKGHASCVFSCAWNLHGNLIASGTQTGNVHYWDVRTGKAVRNVPCHYDPVSSIEFHKDGSILLTASTDGLCRIWDVSTGFCLKTLVEQTNPAVGHARFSPNGNFILVSHMNGSIKLWDYLRAKAKKSYHGHVNESFCIPGGFLLSGRQVLVVSGSEDHKIYLWELNSRKIWQTLIGHSDVVMATACHPNQRCVASAGMEKDRSIRIWTSEP